MITLLLLACAGSSDPTPTAPGPQPTPAEAPVPANPIASASGEGFSDQWLVILSSKKELGVVPEGAKALLADSPPVEAELARLSSTEFKALQPCYEIVVANAFADRAAAVAYSQSLTELGIDNYPKNAGKWVGAQPRVDAYCAGERDPAASACPDDFAHGETADGRHLLAIPLEAAVTSPALAASPAPLRVTDGVWVAPLPDEKLAGHALGDAWTGLAADGTVAACKVERFVAATRGTPHFGWQEHTDESAPGCGEPEVMAELTCEADPDLIGAAQSTFESAHRVDTTPAETGAVHDVLDQDRSWLAFEDEAVNAAGERKVESEVDLTTWESGGRRLVAARGRWITGEGMIECGGDDVAVEAWALVDLKSRSIVAGPFDVYGVSQVVPIDLGSDGRWEVQTRTWTGTTTLFGGSEKQCSLERAYCDCPC